MILVTSGQVYAVNSNEVNNNLNALNNQIKQLNQDLNSKKQQKQKIDAVLKDSNGAIHKSEALLATLRKKRDAELAQLKQLMISIPQMEQATDEAKEQVTQSLTKIYQKIQQIKQDQNKLFAANKSLDEKRNKIYLLEILQFEQNKYQDLNAKLIKLQALNDSLEKEVARLNNELGETSKSHQQLLFKQNKAQQQATLVQKQIAVENNKLSNLKQRQQQLNKLLTQLASNEARQRAAKKQQEQRQFNNANAHNTQDNSQRDDAVVVNSDVSDNSPFFARKLFRPIQGKILVAFGQKRDSVRNNGVLLAVSEGRPIYSVSNGLVLFSGELPGFGQIIVIDNGNNYTSVYSGIVSNISKGSKVAAGQQIAIAGTEATQPMGGVYFELRHLGKPINPGALFK